MRIRTATQDDLDAICRVEAICFPASEAGTRESFAARLKVFPRHFLLLEDGGRLIGFVNGTHALSCAMFSAVKTGDTVLSVTGPAYDTLQNTITGDYCGSMKSYGIGYKQVDLKDGVPDLPAIREAARDKNVKLVFIQRSRGYAVRKTLSVEEIGKVCEVVREVNPCAAIMVDNCYGEFTETIEPTQVGADIIAGSLIKNPGGGLAPTGGYIAGRRDLVENASYKLTAPGIGGECGCTMGQNRLLFQGLFMAPHITAQALKTAIFCAKVMEKLGYEVSPKAEEPRYDIIQTIAFGKPEPLRRFCEGIQSGAPVDSFVTPEPWAMPGYDDPVIMAAGAFVQGASIELSADAPMREPYVCYMQGGLTYSSGKAGKGFICALPPRTQHSKICRARFVSDTKRQRNFLSAANKMKKKRKQKRGKKEKTEKRKGKRKKPQNYETVCQRRFPNTKKTPLIRTIHQTHFCKHKKSLL